MRTTTLRTLTLAAALVGLAACGSAGDDDQVSADDTSTTIAVTDVDDATTDETPESEDGDSDGGDSDQSEGSSTQPGSDAGQSDAGPSDADPGEAGPSGDAADSGDSDDAGDAGDSEDPAGPADDIVDPEPEPEADYSGNPYWSPGLEHKATYRVPVHRGGGDPIEQCLAKGGNPYYNPDAPASSRNTGCSTGRNGRWDHPVPDYDPTIGALDTEIECAWKDAEYVRSKSLSQGKPSVQGGYQWIVYNPSEQVCGSR